jgi:hypothetical protein
MGRIESAYDACRQTSVAANKLVGEQQGALDESSVLLDFLGHHVPAIAQQIEELESLRRMLAPWSEVETAAPAATAESLSHNYTMQSERDIHLRAGQGLADLAVPAGETAAADNLEFFAPPAPPDVKMVLVGQSTTTATQNDNAPSAPAAPEPAGSALGDNVELF